MKYLLICLACLLTSPIFAQRGPLKGSGKMVKKTFDFKDFDKLDIKDFDGKIEVEIGKAHAISIEIDEVLLPLLRVELDKGEYTLSMYLEGNKNGRLYLENANAKIKVSMPESSVITHRGNTSITVTGIVGRYFRLSNSGNGDAIISGKIEGLDIDKIGNGSVYADKLMANTAKISSVGNGNVVINTSRSVKANGAGNGNVIQVGEGDIEAMSGIVGNGKVYKEKKK